MEEKHQSDLETLPVGKLMKRYALPCVTSLLVAALYNIVDQIFIANASYLGSCGNAANTVVFPLTVVALALAGALVNIVLDPIMIFIFHWGMMGAAVATVLGQVLTAALSVWYMFRMKAVRLSRDSFRLHLPLARRYLALGMTSFLSQISLVAAMAAINNMIQHYGARDAIFSQAQYAQIPMAVVGVVMKFFQIVISIAVGLAAGCIPVMGYNVGAGRRDRVRALLARLLGCELAVGFVALLIVELLPRQLIAIFGAANESVYYTEFAVKAFRIYLCLMPLATFNKGTFIALQSLGRALSSTLISLVREVVFGVGFALLLPRFFELNGVLYSMPVSDLLTFIIALVVLTWTWRDLKRPESTMRV